jgi:hypothetical protein
VANHAVCLLGVPLPVTYDLNGCVNFGRKLGEYLRDSYALISFLSATVRADACHLGLTYPIAQSGIVTGRRFVTCAFNLPLTTFNACLAPIRTFLS